MTNILCLLMIFLKLQLSHLPWVGAPEPQWAIVYREGQARQTHTPQWNLCCLRGQQAGHYCWNLLDKVRTRCTRTSHTHRQNVPDDPNIVKRKDRNPAFTKPSVIKTYGAPQMLWISVSPTCQELSSHYSILTSQKLNELKSQHVFLDMSTKSGHRENHCP